MNATQFIEYVEGTLITDLESNRSFETVADFKAAILFIRGASRVTADDEPQEDPEGELTKEEHCDFLENSLVPDLRKLELPAMAADFAAAVLFMQGAEEVEIGEDDATKIH